MSVEVGQDSPDNLIEDKTMQQSISSNEDKDRRFRVKAGIFLASVTGISALVGFGSSLAAAKKQDPSFFNKGMVGTRELTESGASLAMRALGWGTLYAWGGCGLLVFGLWKLSGAKDFKEFRQQMGSTLPRIPKNDPPQGRTEFEGLTDLLTYISSDERKNKPTANEP